MASAGSTSWTKAEPGVAGRELALLLDTLVTGLSMNRALDPDGHRPERLARALRQLSA